METQTNIVTLAHLMGVLSIARGARPATITTVTDARLLKTGNPFGQVFKRSIVNVMVNFNYANAVNNQRGREGEAKDFTPDARKWGTRLPGLPFVSHKGKSYLECRVMRSLSHAYITADGRALTDADVAPFLPTRNSNAEKQGVEKEIIIRDYAVDNMEAIAIDGERFVIDPDSIGEAMEANADALVFA